MILLPVCFSCLPVVSIADAGEPTTDSTNQSAFQKSRGLDGPNSVPVQIEAIEASRKREHASWPSFPPLDKYGLKLAADYNILYQKMSSGPAIDDALGGVARFYGMWELVDRGKLYAGRVVFKVEHRHKINSDIAPKEILPAAGFTAVSGPTFSDAQGVLTNLFWFQTSVDNRFRFEAGVIDVADYLDVYGLVNVWTDFNNLAFSTNPTIPTPSQGIGAAMRWRFTPDYYVIAGIADAKGDPHKPDEFFKSFFKDAEFFTHLEFGHIGSWESRAINNTHFTFWHVDARPEGSLDAGKGVAFSWTRNSHKWQPFIRGGYAEGGASLLKKSVSIGSAYKINSKGDQLTIGYSWGKPFNSDDSQQIVEGYFKWQVFPHVLVVPGVQWLKYPGNAQGNDEEWVATLKCRLTF